MDPGQPVSTVGIGTFKGATNDELPGSETRLAELMKEAGLIVNGFYTFVPQPQFFATVYKTVALYTAC